MKKKLLTSLSSITLVCLLMGGSTYALFSASATNDNNTFTAGTLTVKVNRDAGDYIPGPMFYTTAEEGKTYDGLKNGRYPTGVWYPGKVEHRTLIVENTGSLDVIMKKIKATVTDDNSLNGKDDTILKNELNVTVERTQCQNPGVIYQGTLADLDGQWKDILGTEIGAPGIQFLDFKIEMPMKQTSQNQYQGLSLKVNFDLFIEQLANNP